jgi:hypothetical protein
MESVEPIESEVSRACGERVAEAAAPSAGDTFSPEGHFLGLAQRAVAGDAIVCISMGEMGEVLIDPRRRRYSASIPDPEAFFTAPADRFESHPGQGPSASGYGPERDVAELLWIAAYHASAGRLPAGCSRFDVIRLAHWPNLSRLPADPSAMSFCALLSRRPSAVHVARKLVRASEADAYRFYSAALSAGALETVSRAPGRIEAEPEAEPEPAAPSGGQSVLRQLWNKIAGL